MGPIGVDCKSQVVFYIDSSSIYSVNFVTNAAPKTFDFNGVDGNTTAMEFNNDYSMAYIFSIESTVITINRFNLHTQKSSPMQLHRFSNPVKQAIFIEKGVLLCRTTKGELLLVDINTGHHSGVFSETTHLPCDADCDGEFMKVKNMVDIKNQGYLLAVDHNLKFIKLKTNGELTNLTNRLCFNSNLIDQISIWLVVQRILSS